MSEFWAKTPRSGPVSWGTVQPVLHHMIDVAVTFEALCREVYPSVRAFLTQPYDNPDDAFRSLCVIAAAHDIGKVSPGFEAKVPALAGRLKDEGFPFLPGAIKDHGRSSFEFLWRYLQSHGQQRDFETPSALAQASGCHHGKYIPLLSSIDAPELEGEEWEAARIDHFHTLCRLWRVDTDPFPLPSESPSGEWTMMLAAVISIADWIGSSLDFPVKSVSNEEYVSRRRLETEAAIRKTDLPAEQLRHFAVDFGDLFTPSGEPDRWVATETQQALRDLTENLDGAFIAIVESPTGSGKTEAALYAYAAQAAARGGGVYFGLPTMATTNAQFTRVHEFLAKLGSVGGANLRLLHSEAPLNREFQQLLEQARNGPQEEDRDEAHRVTDWFHGSKRGLLAQHAVGTVDQVMFAAMPVRHHFVRLFGLANKIVIVDEVHAYDTYMRAIIGSLLSWLRQLNIPVILLSATLPAGLRKSLLEQYAGTPVAVESAPGPNVTVWSNRGIECRELPDIPLRAVRIELEELAESSTDAFVNTMARIAIDAVSKGGCVACIVNTVDEAQRVFEQIDHLLPADVYRLLFHARFVRADREKREQEILKRFGKNGSNRPQRAVVVATQVLEQSLDVDFDFMVSDLAPIDLLIQRLGRVHRHLRERPSAKRPHPLPTIRVLSPRAEQFAVRPSLQEIYEPLVLARTMLTLKMNGPELVIPSDVSRMIESVYGDRPVEDSALVERLEAWETQAVGNELSNRFIGRARSIGSPEDMPGDLSLLASGPMAEDDEYNFSTRLSGPSVTAIVLTDHGIPNLDGLLEGAVRVSHRSLVPVLSAVERPDGWDDHWFLRRCVPLDVSGGTVVLGGFAVSYSKDLGLVVRKEG